MKIATHLAESKEESVYIRSGSGVLALDLREKVGWDYLSHEPFGVTPIKYLQQWNVFSSDFMAVHCVYAGPADIEALARYDVAIAHCPKSNAKLGCGIAPLLSIPAGGHSCGFWHRQSGQQQHHGHVRRDAHRHLSASRLRA